MADEVANGMTILVTGASGAIGRFVAQELLDRGNRVAAVTRDASGRKPIAGSLSWHEAALGDTDALEALIRSSGARRVMHLAAAILDAERDIARAVTANAGGTASVFEAAYRTGVERVVYASSKAVLGPQSGEWSSPQFRPVPEEHPRNPHSVYALTKSMGEDLACFYGEQRGLEIVSVRFGTSCGPGKGPQHGGAAKLGHMIENAVHGKPAAIEQGGDQIDDIMYTGEIAQGLVQLCLAAGSVSGVMHLASDRPITLRELAEAIRVVVPGAEISVGPGQDYMQFGGIYCKLDDTRARQEAGYRPRYDLHGWIRAYVDHIKRSND